MGELVDHSRSAEDPGRLMHVAVVPVLDEYTMESASVQEEVPLKTASAVRPQGDTAAPPMAFPPAGRGKLVVDPDISPVTVEQYRRLAGVLHDLQVRHGLKTLMVTSAAPQEGKTLTSVNLALTLSGSYKQRVLLIDADLRRPSVHHVFGIPNGAGVADIVTSGGPMPLVAISPCLSVLTAGRRTSSAVAMLTSERIRAVVDDAAAQFDWVLLDTPPVALLPDAQLVARLTEGVLFVIAAGKTPYALVKHAVDELGVDRIVGTVLNQVDERVFGEHYQSYYS
jgi:capsular exopolysaccharide synthesis family protein